MQIIQVYKLQDLFSNTWCQNTISYVLSYLCTGSNVLQVRPDFSNLKTTTLINAKKRHSSGKVYHLKRLGKYK